MSQVGRVREFVCAWISRFFANRAVGVPVLVAYVAAAVT